MVELRPLIVSELLAGEQDWDAASFSAQMFEMSPEPAPRLPPWPSRGATSDTFTFGRYTVRFRLFQIVPRVIKS